MNLARRCRHSTNDLIRARGVEVARQRKVEILSRRPDDQYALAAVRGSSPHVTYDVFVDWRGVARDLLVVSCTCPYAEVNVVCKHIWALIVELDRTGLARSIPGEQTLELVVDTHETFDSLDLFGDFTALDARVGSREPRLPTTSDLLARTNPIANPWRRRLHELDREVASFTSIEPPKPNHEVWFLVEREKALSTAGSLHVEFFQRNRKPNGDWTLLKTFSVPRMGPRAVAPELLPTLELLLDLAPDSEPWRYSSYGAPPGVTSANIPFHLMPLVMPRLCASGHFGWRDANRTITPITWDDGPPWQFVLFGEEHPGLGLAISGRLEREGETRDLFDAVIYLVNGLVVFADHAARWGPIESFPWVRSLRVEGDLQIPAPEMTEAIQSLWLDPQTPKLHLPEALEPRIEDLAGTPRIELSFHGSQIQGHLRFAYLDETVSLSDWRLLLAGRDPRTSIRRDRAAERRAAETLAAEDWLVTASGDLTFRGERLSTAIAAIQSRGWQVAFEGRLVRNSTRSGLRVESGIDWFDLWGDFDFDGVATTLPRVTSSSARSVRLMAEECPARARAALSW